MKYPRSLINKKYPKFFKNEIFKKFPKPEKIFSKIGLKNCFSKIKESKSTLIDFVDRFMGVNFSNRSIDQNFREDIVNIEKFLYDWQTKWSIKDPERDSNGNYYIKYTGKNLKFFKLDKNKDIKSIKNQLKTKIKCNKKEIDEIFNSYSDLKIHFSSDGPKGFWDIATMSMRGIKSCMRWNSKHAKSLIGSVLDPYAGVIYITDNKYTRYGNNMVARAVVRFVINNRDEPSIFIENIYLNGDIADYDSRESWFEIFSDFLKEKINLSIYNDGDSYYNKNLYIPLSKQTELLLDNDKFIDYKTYTDAELEYFTNIKFNTASKSAKEVKKYLKSKPIDKTAPRI